MRGLALGAAIGLIALCATSCGELARPQPTASVITFTLTPTGCTVDGVGALLPTQFNSMVINKTASLAVFNFRRMVDGHAYGELETWIQQRQRRIAAGTDQPKVAELALPPWTTLRAQSFVNPRRTDTFEVELGSGIYGLVCRRDRPLSDDTEAIYVIGPFRVV